MILLAGVFVLVHADNLINSQDDDTKAYKQAYNLILDEKWDSAILAFEKFIDTYPESRWVDDAHFWHCYAMEKKGENPEEVFACYQKFVNTYGKSKWTNDAKANLIRLGQKLVSMGKTEYENRVRSMKASEDEEISLAALYALQSIGDEKASRAIMDLYRKSKSKRIREMSVYVLGSSDAPEATKILIEVAQSDADPGVRKKAVQMLYTKIRKKQFPL